MADRPTSGDADRWQHTSLPAPLPSATVARLVGYLRILSEQPAGAVVSSADLAREAGVNSSLLRRDLSLLGSYGTRGVGYDVTALARQLQEALGVHRTAPVALVGLGHLGRALAGFSGFVGRGLHFAELFDIDPAVIGTEVAGLTVADVAELAPRCRAAGIGIGVVATPASAAQQVVDDLVAAGVTSVLCFAPGAVRVPDGVELRQVDLALELQVLALGGPRRHRVVGG